MPAEDGVHLDVHVRPGASRDVFPGPPDRWRGCITAAVTAAPRGGAANESLCRLVAGFFGVSASAVRVVSGHTSRRKRLHIEGIDEDTARCALEGP